jgi:hypothetical protein
MAITRINNNQITDAIAGNVYYGVNAAAKLQNYSVTSQKISNNLTYGSDLTITGNLTVQGNVTAIDTVDLIVEDPLILLASNQTGSPTLDIGFIGKRGTSENIAFVWKENAQQFEAVFTNSEVSNTTINVTSFANLQVGNFVAQTANITGDTTFANVTVGNVVGNLTVTGNVQGGNLLTGGLISSTGNVNGGNLISAALVQGVTVSASGNLVGGNANITSAVNSATVSASGNITGGNVLYGSGIVSGTGNINSGNLISAALVQGVTVSASGNLVGGNANITSAVNSATVSASGSITGGNILFGSGVVSGTGNITGGNLISAALVQGVTVSATGNVNGGNVNTATLTNPSGAVTVSTVTGDINLSPAGNIVLSNDYINGVAYPVQDADAASKIYVDNKVTTAISYHEAVLAATNTTLATATGGTVTYSQPNGAGNGIGALLTTTGAFNLIDTANVQNVGTRILVKNEGNAVFNGVYTWANATNIVRSSDTDTYAPADADALSINDYFFVSSGNINAGSAWIVDAPTGTITFGASNISFAQFSQSQVYSANTSAGLVLVGQTFNAKVDNNTTAFDIGGNIIVKDGANLTTPNIGAATGISLSVTGTVTGATISATGNVVGGNVLTGGLVSATGNATFGNIGTNQLSLSGNVISALNVTGNITGANLITGGNVFAPAIIANSSTYDTRVSLNSAAGIVEINSNGNATQFTPSGQINLSGVSTIAGGTFTGSGFTAGSSQTDLFQNRGGNVTVQVGTGGTIASTWTFAQGGNLLAPGAISAIGNLIGGNISTTGQANLGNIRISGDTITGTNGQVLINSAGADVNFIVSGDTIANLLVADAGSDTVLIGTGTPTTNAALKIGTTNSMIIPVGTTSERPDVPVTGMLRFNTTGDTLEFYDSDSWATAGSVFTVITADEFVGNGVQTIFTLSENSTTASTIVAINGVVQQPTTAYSVSAANLTFTEAPESTDVIDVRLLTTTTTVVGIQNSSGNAVLQGSSTAAQFDVTGDFVPTANITYDLGTTTARWKDLYLSGTSLYLGNVIMKASTGNSVAFFQPDGTTPATIASSSIDTTQIANGTSSVAVVATNGNIRANVGGATIVSITSAGIQNGQGNGVGNIGSATTYFNTVFAKATSAQYADLAEMYEADQIIEPGTVVCFGGAKEVTMCAEDACRRVAGVVSTNPSYLMNSGQTGDHVVPIALQGRVPVKVTGVVRKGDMMVATSNGRARAENNPAVGAVIGKALADFDGQDGVIEVVIGRV